MPVNKSLLDEYESSIAAIEPSPDDLKIYKRMGLDTYVSPSGQRYPLIQDYFSPPPQKRAVGINKELLESFELGEHEDVKENKSKLPPIADPDQPLTHFADPVPPTGIQDITDPQDIEMRKKAYVPLEEKLGIPEIFKGIREMVAPSTPYTEEESDRMASELGQRVVWMGKYIPTFGGRLGGKDFRKRLLEEAESFAGFGPAIAPAAGEMGTLALEWGIIYPYLFKLAGLGGAAVSKIPRVAKAAAALKKAGGLEKVAEKLPRAYARTANIIKAMAKGAGVGGFMAGAESIGKEMEPGEILQHVGKRAALMAGIAGTFQAVSEVDTAIYTRRLRNALIKVSNSRFAAKIREVNAMSKSTAKTAAYKSLTSLKKAELQAIDKIVSATEANLIGLKKNKLYQLGQEVVERPDRAAQRLMKYGLEKVGEVPKGVEKLTKGLGKTEPFIKMPLTRTAEVIESTRELGALLRKPSRIAERILRTKLPAKPTKISPKPVMPKGELYDSKEKEGPAEVKPSGIFQEQVAETPPTEAITAPEPTPAAITPEIPLVGIGKILKAMGERQARGEPFTLDELRTMSEQIEEERGKELSLEELKIIEEEYYKLIDTQIKALEAEAPPTEKVREPTEHLVAMPRAKGAREIEPTKGETILIENPEEKGDYQKYEDFGTGILRKGNKLYHKASLKEIEKFSTVKNARKAAQTLAQEDIDFELEDVEKIRAQFQQWQKDKDFVGDIEAYLIGKGKELEGEDYPEIIRTMAWVREKDTIIKKLKDFVSEVPEFALNPVLTYKEGYLVFSDGYRFKFVPDYFGINKEALTEGDKIRFDLENLGIKKPSAKKLKAAEIWTGEPKIMGRVAEKPIPVERLGLERKPRKLIAKEETYERALVDIETGKEVKVEGGVTYKTVREEDIRRVAELGRKAGRQAWTVERDILGRQERGTAETKLGIGDAIKIIRNVFAAKPKEVEPKAPEKIEPLKTYHAEVELPNKEKAAFDYQYIEYPKTGQHEYGFNFHNKTIGDPKTGIIHHSAKATEVDAAGGPIEYARQWAAKRYTEVRGVREAKPKPIRKEKIEDPDKYREQLIAKWGEDKFDKVWFELAEGGENERFSDIDARVGELDEAGRWNDTETKQLRIEMDSIVDAELEKREAKAKPEEPTEEPSEFIPEAAEPKHIKNVVVDTFREWPKGIKKVGKDYWVEVMAVAKQLTTPYRYKALRQTMLGVFRHKKRPVPQVVGIEIQDITDALTATHELAHNIDWLLNNKIFPSSIKGRFPGATVGEMSLRKELKKISQVLRPDMWERPKAYIKSHVELMADFISHYILDPEKVRELAPNLTRAFEAKLAAKPELFDTISRLQESRYTGPEEPPIARHIREVFPLPKEFTPLKLAIDMTKDSYVKAAEELGITAARHYKLLIQRAQKEADRIDELVPDKARQTDLVVVAEKGSKNPWTGKTREEILKDALTANEKKAINLFRAYQEKARQTVNKYLRGADIAEYIKFIEDYFIHAYETPLTEKYKTAIARWAKRSPQAKKRVLPDLAKAVELGMKPRAKTLSEGLKLWAGINYRVMTNKAFLRILPNITNDDGVSILQKPQDYPYWPTVDYWPIRQNYAVPLPNRGILLFQGRVAVDPRVKPFIDAMFGRKVFNTPVRIIEGLNATWKAFQLTLFSLFHHQAEFFSACGSLGPRALPFVGGYYGKRAQVFGKKPKLWGVLPAHIGVLKAGKQLEKTPEFMDDYLAHGGQRGYISTEGINLIERTLKRAADYLENIIQYRPTTPLTGVYAAAYVPVKAAQAAYSFHQSLLWDNVNRAKLVSYYSIVADGAKNSNLPIKDVKEIAVKYINDNFGGQEWLNSMFRDRKTRQFWTQLMMSLDWTWSQIKTARWPFGIGEKGKERRAFMRKRGRHHWFWYLSAIAGFTIAGSYAMSGHAPWDNEKGHKLDIDWTNVWRNLPWNRDWKQRGDYARRYISIGKAGRELVRWVTSPLLAFGYKLSPVARSIFEQSTGYNLGSDWAEPWAREDLELYQEVYARFKHLMDNFKPFAFSGNNAFLAFPSRKGMTRWKATRAYEDIYKARAIIAMGGIGGKIAKAHQILKKDEEKLRVQITEACKLNNVDVDQADRAALSGVRSKYYNLFWKATEMPEKKAVSLCNAYANALHELGITPKGFKQSLMYRIKTLPERAREIGLEAIQKVATER